MPNIAKHFDAKYRLLRLWVYAASSSRSSLFVFTRPSLSSASGRKTTRMKLQDINDAIKYSDKSPGIERKTIFLPMFAVLGFRGQS